MAQMINGNKKEAITRCSVYKSMCGYEKFCLVKGNWKRAIDKVVFACKLAFAKGHLSVRTVILHTLGRKMFTECFRTNLTKCSWNGGVDRQTKTPEMIRPIMRLLSSIWYTYTFRFGWLISIGVYLVSIFVTSTSYTRSCGNLNGDLLIVLPSFSRFQSPEQR